MKLFIGTMNGGGNVLYRLYKNFSEYISPQLSKYDWKWTILVQGNKGLDQELLIEIQKEYPLNVDILLQKENLGVVKGTNELIKHYNIYKSDIFWMIDDDILFTNEMDIDIMIRALDTHMTCATQVCWFGKKLEYSKTNPVIDIPDHGSGCTMYKKDVYEKCGGYDHNITQYGSDTEFNNRIKLAFGDKSLSLLCGNQTTHTNQTGTFNCYTRQEWDDIIKKDNEYIRNKKYDKIFISTNESEQK